MNGFGTGSTGLIGQIDLSCSNNTHSCLNLDIFCETGWTTRCDWECDGTNGCSNGNCQINGLCDPEFVREPTLTYDSNNHILYAMCDKEDQCFDETINCNDYLTNYPNMLHCVIGCTGEDACTGVSMICPDNANLDCTIICGNYASVCKYVKITANDGKNLVIVANSSYALQYSSFVFFFGFFLFFCLWCFENENGKRKECTVLWGFVRFCLKKKTKI